MKKNSIIHICIIAILGLSSCEKYTDIQPKGKNLLGTVDELEYLLNYNFGASNAFYLQNLSVLDNDTYIPLGNVANTLSGPKDVNYALITYDQSVNRAQLTKNDPSYQEAYSIISNRLNIVLQQVDKATGSETKKSLLKAEALTMRAYLHYLLVNVYAKAYTAATASTNGGIAYMDQVDYERNPTKSTVAEVYTKMLSDVDAAIAMNSLPDVSASNTRGNKAFAYAVKAQIMLSMGNYTEALAAADKALTYRSTLEDHRPFVATKLAVRAAYAATDNLLFAATKQNNPTFLVASVEILNNYFERGNIIREYTNAYSYTLGGVNYSETYGRDYGIPGALMFYDNDYQHNNAGMTVSDLMFIRAESLIRLGRISEGMDVINYIRQRRINPTVYAALSATTEPAAMAILKKLSRIEFLYTWKNFVNIKRWNTETAYRESITRTISGITYTLSPESPLWVFPFPQSATDYNPNLTQN